MIFFSFIFCSWEVLYGGICIKTNEDEEANKKKHFEESRWAMDDYESELMSNVTSPSSSFLFFSEHVLDIYSFSSSNSIQ